MFHYRINLTRDIFLGRTLSTTDVILCPLDTVHFWFHTLRYQIWQQIFLFSLYIKRMYSNFAILRITVLNDVSSYLVWLMPKTFLFWDSFHLMLWFLSNWSWNAIKNWPKKYQNKSKQFFDTSNPARKSAEYFMANLQFSTHGCLHLITAFIQPITGVLIAWRARILKQAEGE